MSMIKIFSDMCVPHRREYVRALVMGLSATEPSKSLTPQTGSAGSRQKETCRKQMLSASVSVSALGRIEPDNK